GARPLHLDRLDGVPLSVDGAGVHLAGVAAAQLVAEADAEILEGELDRLELVAPIATCAALAAGTSFAGATAAADAGRASATITAASAGATFSSRAGNAAASTVAALPRRLSVRGIGAGDEQRCHDGENEPPEMRHGEYLPQDGAYAYRLLIGRGESGFFALSARRTRLPEVFRGFESLSKALGMGPEAQRLDPLG